MKPRQCRYGNCTETAVRVSVHIPEMIERCAFCSLQHAALYLLRHAYLDAGGAVDRRAQFAAIETQIINTLKAHRP